MTHRPIPRIDHRMTPLNPRIHTSMRQIERPSPGGAHTALNLWTAFLHYSTKTVERNCAQTLRENLPCYMFITFLLDCAHLMHVPRGSDVRENENPSAGGVRVSRIKSRIRKAGFAENLDREGTGFLCRRQILLFPVHRSTKILRCIYRAPIASRCI